jgi:hypothetical protein
MVSWVFAHLRADERELLNQLAIFEDPFTMRAAAEVVAGLDGTIYPTMERLIDKSVLIPYQQHDRELTLAISGVVRLAAARSLAQSPDYQALRQTHAEYFRVVADGRTGAESAVVGAGRRFPQAQDFRADLLVAFSYWREAGDRQAMAAIASAVWDLCTGAGPARQCLQLAEEVLRLGGQSPPLHARALEAAGEMAMRLGSAAARGYLSRARAAYQGARDQSGVIRCLQLLGDEAYAAGDLDCARCRFEESLAALGEAGQDTGAGDHTSAARQHLTRRLAVVLRDAGSLTQAGELAQAALTPEFGGEGADGAVLTKYVLASIGWLERDSVEARAHFAEAAE